MTELTNSPRILVIILNYRTPQMTLRAAQAALADMEEMNATVLPGSWRAIFQNADGTKTTACV